MAGRAVLLVRRFDRDWRREGYHRHRMVSALTLLQTDDSRAGRARWSYLLLADEIRRVSEAPAEDLRELFTRMRFNAAVSNLDDHPRNHAVLAKGNGWAPEPGIRPDANAIRRRRKPRSRHGVRAGRTRAAVETSHASLEQLAEISGFGDPGRVCRAFVRSFGLPPQALRRTARVQWA